MKCKKNIARIVGALAILAILAGTVFAFSQQLKTTLTKEVYRTLSDVSVDYNKAFLDRISYNIQTMNVIAGGLVEMENPSKQDVVNILQNAVEDGGFIQIAVCDVNGISYSNKGVSADISSRAYFQKAMQGETNISEPLVSLVNGEKVIIVAVPIYRQMKVIGALLGLYPIETAGAQLLDFTYYSNGYGFVISPDGTILLSSEHTDKLADENNLFSFFEKTNMANFSVEDIKTTIKNGESKSFSFIYKGERRFVSFMPSTINGWYTFSIASDALMLQQEKDTGAIVAELVIKLVVAGILLLIWIVISNHRHNKQILVANQRYQSLLLNINGGMIVANQAVTAEETIVTYVSSGFTEMTGYTLEDIQTLYHGRYLDVIYEEDRQGAFEKYLEQTANEKTYQMPYRIHKKDGSLLWVMDNGYIVDNQEGLHNHSIITDITVIKQQEEELRLSENRFSLAVNASSGTLFEVDLQKQLYTHFENSERIFGVKSEKLLADTRAFSTLPHDDFVDAVTNYFFHPEDRTLAKNTMEELLRNGNASYEARLRRGDDSYIWAKVDLSLNFDDFGVPSKLIGFMSDIDDIKKQAEILENKVQTDPMTGLYNKVAMATLSNKLLTDDPNEQHALIVLDIDNFKGINDTLGHAFGDVVLIDVATKLKTLFRNNDIVGRMGGDEFSVLMKKIPDTNGVLKKATELSAAFRQTYAGEKEDYKISCSMGIIILDQKEESFEALYRKADAALYQAKQNGRDQFVLYREEDADKYPTTSTRTNDEELQNLKVFHNIEEHIFELLYASKDFNISINMALATIGQQYHVSRVAVFENEDHNQAASVIYEWCNEGVQPAIDNTQNMKISNGIESVMDCFDENGLFYCNNVRELSPYPRQLLESQGVLSTLKVTITNDDKLCGFIGFDECKQYRIWTSEEIEKLSFLAKVLSVFLFKEKGKIALLENLHTRLKILDTLPDYISVVNPETHAIEYTNRKMQKLLPSATIGAFCFTALRGGQDGPCGQCLVERIKQGDTDNLEIISEDQKLRLKVKALSINWTNERKMVLLYGTEQDKKSL